MRQWICTPCNQVLDLANLESIWIESTISHKVFAKDKDGKVWVIAEFEEKEIANDYINVLYELKWHYNV